jgi:hypothetical protein
MEIYYYTKEETKHISVYKSEWSNMAAVVAVIVVVAEAVIRAAIIHFLIFLCKLSSYRSQLQGLHVQTEHTRKKHVHIA